MGTQVKTLKVPTLEFHNNPFNPTVRKKPSLIFSLGAPSAEIRAVVEGVALST